MSEVAMYNMEEANVVTTKSVARNADGTLQVASSRDAAVYLTKLKSDKELGIGLFNPNIDIPDEILAALLIREQGRIAKIATLLNVSATLLTKYVNERPAFRDIVDHFISTRIEAAEEAIDEQIAEGDVAAAKFLLSNLAKDKGYTADDKKNAGNVNVIIQRAIYGAENVYSAGAVDVPNKY